MACEFHKDENGEVVKISCGRGNPRCYFCGKPSMKLCDFPLGSGTCDAQMCKACSTNVSHEVDLCPKHKQHAERMKQLR